MSVINFMIKFEMSKSLILLTFFALITFTFSQSQQYEDSFTYKASNKLVGRLLEDEEEGTGDSIPAE